MKKYRMCNKNTYFLFQEVLIDFIVLVFTTVFLWYFFEDEIELFVVIFVILFSVFVGLIFLPVLYLYENYSKYNKNLMVLFHENSVVINDEEMPIFEIIDVNIYGTYQLFNKNDGGIGTLAYNPYFYYLEINLKANRRIILSSILGQSIKDDMMSYYPKLNYKNNIKSFPKINGS